jgi:hypothetical protein
MKLAPEGFHAASSSAWAFGRQSVFMDSFPRDDGLGPSRSVATERLGLFFLEV